MVLKDILLIINTLSGFTARTRRITVCLANNKINILVLITMLSGPVFVG